VWTRKPLFSLLTVLVLCLFALGAVTQVNLATQAVGILPTASMPALTGNVTSSAGSVSTTIAAGAVVASMEDQCTARGYATQGSLTNPAATTDTQLAEFSLSSACLNTANKTMRVYAHIVTATGTTQTPTYTVKVKVCTVSGCGSGTVVTACSFGPSGAMTASTTVHAEMECMIMTTTTGSSGVLESAGFGILNVTSASGTGGVLWNDINTAGSSTINLTSTLFIDVVGQLSTQSGTKNSMQARLATVKPEA
jgi:hypothetical protein